MEILLHSSHVHDVHDYDDVQSYYGHVHVDAHGVHAGVRDGVQDRPKESHDFVQYSMQLPVIEKVEYLYFHE